MEHYRAEHWYFILDEGKNLHFFVNNADILFSISAKFNKQHSKAAIYVIILDKYS